MLDLYKSEKRQLSNVRAKLLSRMKYGGKYCCKRRLRQKKMDVCIQREMAWLKSIIIHLNSRYAAKANVRTGYRLNCRANSQFCLSQQFCLRYLVLSGGYNGRVFGFEFEGKSHDYFQSYRNFIVAPITLKLSREQWQFAGRTGYKNYAKFNKMSDGDDKIISK